MWVQLLAVMKKEVRQAFRDRRMAAMLLAVPVVQLIVFGYAVDLDVDHIPTVVCDQDRTHESRTLSQAFLAGDTFVLQGQTEDADMASQMLENGDASAALIIPKGFALRLGRQEPAPVQVLVDGSDPNRAQIAAASSSQFIADKAFALSKQRISEALSAMGGSRSLPQVVIQPRILYNQRLTSSIYMVPAVAAMALLVVTTILTAMGIAREREIGTIEQVLVTPLSPSVLLTGKCLPFALIGLFDVTALLAAGAYLFDVPLRGSLLLIYGATLLYLMTTLGVGVFISTICRSQQQAILGGFFFIMPAMLLSGFVSPIENMPDWIKPITWINPVRYYVEIMRDCLLKSSDALDLLPQLAALLLFGFAILSLSTLRFRKRLA